MNEQYQDPAEKKPRICKVAGVPERDEEGRLTRRELFAWEQFCRLFGEKFKKTVELGEAYAEAKVAQEANAARKTAEEAAEIAARKRQINAETQIKKDKSALEAEKARQETVKTVIEDVDRILHLLPEGQGIAMAKLLMENPDIQDQLDKIVAAIEKLHQLKSLTLTPLLAEEPVEKG